MVNLQTSFALANMATSNKLELGDLISKLTTNPRKILGLENPSIAEGEIANLTVFNPTQEWTLEKEQVVSKSYNTPLLGKTLTGAVLAVINNNTIKRFDS